MASYRKSGKWNIHSWDGGLPYYDTPSIAISRIVIKLCELGQKTSLGNERYLYITAQMVADFGEADDDVEYVSVQVDLNVRKGWQDHPDRLYAAIMRQLKMADIEEFEYLLLILDNDKKGGGHESGTINGQLKPAQEIEKTE